VQNIERVRFTFICNSDLREARNPGRGANEKKELHEGHGCGETPGGSGGGKRTSENVSEGRKCALIGRTSAPKICMQKKVDI